MVVSARSLEWLMAGADCMAVYLTKVKIIGIISTESVPKRQEGKMQR
jgi:hypothetical protein